jgi:hypothetical protein
MENKLREIDILNYLPPVVRDTAEFQAIAKAENPEFNNFLSCIYQALQDSFVQDASEYGVKRWEAILSITPAEGATLDERKAAILAYLSVKLPYTWRVLERMLIGMLGEGNVSVKLNNDTATLTVAVALDTTEAQIAEIESLLDRVLPSNLVTELEWVNGLPIDYKAIEYLESTRTQYIKTGILPTGRLTTRITILSRVWDGGNNTNLVFGAGENGLNYLWSMNYNGGYGTVGRYWYGSQFNYLSKLNYLNTKYDFVFDKNIITRNGEPITQQGGKEFALEDFEFTKKDIWIFNVNGHYNEPNSKVIFCFSITEDGIDRINLIPAIDPTGTPCMYDLISKTPFYNSGTGDFLYPGKETEATTYSLRNRMYAKYTEHGIRRLYRVPAGYNSKEEYAEKHGFKILVETPMPEEGYWAPVWHEREDCIELEWVETEPPTEEVIENE